MCKPDYIGWTLNLLNDLDLNIKTYNEYIFNILHFPLGHSDTFWSIYVLKNITHCTTKVFISGKQRCEMKANSPS